ncbi:uncharacterized protein LOC116616314 [Nematostella vectensis]|uniref:uncharacterized protein LOC116616314 n=1 Tax=Nematostella vectensis TaxID=45351 RepID=UPI0020776B40|nr:uncharacterized protein LOC116616314 [Nematostella vectensis]
MATTRGVLLIILHLLKRSPLTLASQNSTHQACIPLKGTPLEGCLFAGYNTTYSIPTSIRLSDAAESRIRNFISALLKMITQCSAAQIGEVVFCSEFAPYCRETDDGPFLPCRRVCSEYLKRCEGTVGQYFLEFSVGMCSLLPNDTASSGKCYEPPGFDRYHNVTTTGLLEGDCAPLIFPVCDDVGYKHSAISIATQSKVYQMYYGKAFTNTSADRSASPGSYMGKLLQFIDTHPKCSYNLKQLFCADHFPPCFPEEGFALYTLCRPLCKQLAVHCPDLLQTPSYIRVISECDIRTVDGNSSSGFCKQTKWPPPVRWLQWFQDPLTQSPPTAHHTPVAPAISTTVIIIAVILPVVLVAMFLLAVLAWRQHRLPTICLRGQDKKELVT